MDDALDLQSGGLSGEGSESKLLEGFNSGDFENKRLKKSIKKLNKQNHIINLLKKTEGALIAQKIAEKVTGESEECLIAGTDKIKRRKSDESLLGSLADEAQAPICYSPNAPKDLNKK